MAFQTFVAHQLTHMAAEAVGCMPEVIGYLANAANPYKLPSLEALIHANQRGYISDPVLQTAARGHCVQISPNLGIAGQILNPLTGGIESLWNRVYYASQELPTVHEYFQIANRKQLLDSEVQTSLQRWGFLGDKTRADLANLRYEIPGPADMVRFSVRHVFEPDLIAKLGYDQEYNQALDVWHQFQGLNYEIWTGPMQPHVQKFESDHGLGGGYFASLYAAQGVPEPTWARAYWWSHWVLPSPTQGYLMWQRLNPIRDPSYDGPEMQGLNFDLADLQLLLRANDYPPQWRNLLAAISRPIPGVRFARDFRRNGVYDFNALLNWGIRQGYSNQDAFDIASDIEQSVLDQQQKKQRQQGLTQLKNAFDVGILDIQAAITQAEQWGLDPDEATVFGQVISLDKQIHRAKQGVASIRRQYLAGKLSDQQAQAVLAQFGLLAQAIQDYLTDWALEKQTNVKHVAAGKAIGWACKGMIPLPELGARLTNLGYDPADIAVMMVEAQLCQQNLAARAAAQAARQAAAQHKQLVAAQRIACQQFQQARRAIAAHGSPAQLRKWYCEGSVGAPELFDRLRFLGWPDVDIERLISDCKSGQPAPSVPPGPGPLQTTGPKPPAGGCPPGP